MTKKEYKEMLDLVIDTYIVVEVSPWKIGIRGDSSYTWLYDRPIKTFKNDTDIKRKMNEYIIKRKKDLP